MPDIKKVIIIGGGPAGLSAAVYNSRAGLQPLVFAGSPPGGQLMLTTDVENYPGYEGIMGPDLVQIMRKQAIKFGTKIVDDNIMSVDFTKKPFRLTTSKQEYPAEAVIIATGAKALWLDLDSETRLRGKGLSACATCDGFFFKNKIVAVVGGGDTAMEETQTLSKFAKKIYLIHRRDSFRASKIMQERVKKNPKVEIIWNSEVKEILGEKIVEGVKIRNTAENSEKTLELHGVFIAIGHKPDTELFKSNIQLDKKGYILTTEAIALQNLQSSFIDPSINKNSKIENSLKNDNLKLKIPEFDINYQTSTSVSGVFAAGDCVDHTYRQAGTAAGMGIAAAIDAERWLENQ